MHNTHIVPDIAKCSFSSGVPWWRPHIIWDLIWFQCLCRRCRLPVLSLRWKQKLCKWAVAFLWACFLSLVKSYGLNCKVFCWLMASMSRGQGQRLTQHYFFRHLDCNCWHTGSHGGPASLAVNVVWDVYTLNGGCTGWPLLPHALLTKQWFAWLQGWRCRSVGPQTRAASGQCQHVENWDIWLVNLCCAVSIGRDWLLGLYVNTHLLIPIEIASPTLWKR